MIFQNPLTIPATYDTCIISESCVCVHLPISAVGSLVFLLVYSYLCPMGGPVVCGQLHVCMYRVSVLDSTPSLATMVCSLLYAGVLGVSGGPFGLILLRSSDFGA